MLIHPSRHKRGDAFPAARKSLPNYSFYTVNYYLSNRAFNESQCEIALAMVLVNSA